MSAERRELADDRKPEPEAPPSGMIASGDGELHELVEDARGVALGDADAGVDDVDANVPPAPPKLPAPQ